MNKISGLEEKLAAAKKKSVVDSSGTSLVAAEESSLARELRMAAATLADLKAKNALKESDEREVIGDSSKKNKKASVKKIINDDDDDDSESEVSSTVAKDNRKGVAPQVAASAGLGKSNSPAAGARNSASIEEASSGTRLSGGTAGEFARAGAVVLTGLDGASTTKITESINKMIIAEAGKPFYIEEGGFVKEIIPEIVNGVIVKGEDGAPIYKTVIKGKIGEFKIDSKGLKIKKDQISKSNSAADVKRQDEEKSRAEVIRYRELQELVKLKK